MQYGFTIRSSQNGYFEVKFTDFVGALQYFSCKAVAEKEAIVVFIDAVQRCFEDDRLVPAPSPLRTGDFHLQVPEAFAKTISMHNETIEKSGALQSF